MSPTAAVTAASNLMKWKKANSGYQEVKAEVNAFRSVHNFKQLKVDHENKITRYMSKSPL